MSMRGQITVALLAMGAGLAALGAFWLVARPDATNTTVAIGTLIYATAYVLAVPRAERFLRRFPVLADRDATAH